MYIRSVTIDYLSERFKDDKSSAVVYFYWNYQSQQEQTATKFIATLLKQLLCFIPYLPPMMKSFYEQIEAKRPNPESGDFDQLNTLFFEISKLHFKTVFIALDALDECSEEALTAVLPFFNQCSSSASFKIVATSRPSPASLQRLFSPSHQISCVEIEAHDSDVQNWIENQLATILDFDLELKAAIARKVGSGIAGMHCPLFLH
jgi:hypothetical protein